MLPLQQKLLNLFYFFSQGRQLLLYCWWLRPWLRFRHHVNVMFDEEAFLNNNENSINM